MAFNYNPDVLDALANLSNDEVFTPPNLVNDMLDLLPEEIWSDSSIRILDPATKTGVFLREAAKRFIKGLEKEFPDLQERVNHIFTKQLFGISITELTGLIGRRGLYCSKIANGKYSVCTDFDTVSGHIRYERTEHQWSSGKCAHCGASQEVYDRSEELETHAYKFIHTDSKDIPALFGLPHNMKFDVIIGNPPYQLSTNADSAQATPLYHKFINQAKKLSPRYLTMIVPARWYSGGMGLGDFRREMLNDTRIRVLHDFLDATDCFTGVDIKGGVCYFLWDRDNQGKCMIVTHSKDKINKSIRYLLENGGDVFIRFNEAIPILSKIKKLNEDSYSTIVSSQRPFGLPTNFYDYVKDSENSFKVYANKKIGYIFKNHKLLKNKEMVCVWKIYTPKAIGSGVMREDLVKPIIGEPNSVCTETYVVHGPFDTQEHCNNAITYIQTNFFHFLLGLKKVTQDSLKKVYDFIPLQDFSESWDDEKLFDKYNLSQEEREYIISMTHPSL